MRYFYYPLCASIIISMIWCNHLDAQILHRDVICTSGGSYTSGSLQLCFTTGEAVAEPVSNQGILVRQGYQPEKLLMTDIEQTDETAIHQLVIFPNPTTDTFVIKRGSDQPIALYILDAQGRAIFHTKLFGNAYEGSMVSWPSGPYFFVFQNEKGVPIGVIPVSKQ